MKIIVMFFFYEMNRVECVEYVWECDNVKKGRKSLVEIFLRVLEVKVFVLYGIMCLEIVIKNL